MKCSLILEKHFQDESTFLPPKAKAKVDKDEP